MRKNRFSGLHKATAASVIAVAVLSSAPALATEAGSRQTREYVDAAGHSCAFETMEADAVLAQSVDPQVRAFAQQMIHDHDQLNQALLQATNRAGLKPPPATVGADQAALLAALQNVREVDMDRAYWRGQVLGHRAALITTQQYAATGDDPAVRQAATSSLPIIAAHLAMAEQMKEKSGGR